MNRLFSILVAAIAAFTLGACANPWWDRDDDTQPTATGTQDQTPDETGTTGQAEPTGTGTTGQSDTGAGSTAGTTEQDNEAFAQAIEKCQSMQGTAYQDCVDKARKDHGQM